QASKDENGKLVLTSADGRGIKITGSIGVGAGILQKENYGRLSLVKNDGRDINISGINLSAIGMGAADMISQASVSLRESKGQISAANADAMGFNSYNGGGAKQIVIASSIGAYMSQAGSGFSKGSGFSVGSGKGYSSVLSASIQIVSSAASISNTYVV
ncbi:flagellin, partial [Campylobacter jejuni]